MKVKISDIIISKEDSKTKRFRKDFGDILELAESLKTIGLIHPIVVDEIKYSYEDALRGKSKYRLIAGERRLRAAIMAGWTEIEVTLKSDMTDSDAKEMELEENIRRQDITWEEQCEALRQIHELKQSKHGIPSRSKEGWGIKQTAQLIGASDGVVSQDIKLAKQLNEHPELRRKVRKLNKASARKLVDQVLAAQGLRKVMKERGVNIGFNLENMPCEKGLKLRIPDNSIHCLITDPPFALDKISKVGSGTADKGLHYNTTGTNVSTEADLTKIYNIIIPELYKKLVVGGHFYIFLGFGWYTRLVSLLRKSSFIVDDQPIIWDKMRTTLPARGCHYTSCYEAILFGYKPPQKRVLFKPTANILHVPALPNQGRVHPMQKPFDLIKIMVENSTSPGETILDCFAGSGSTLHAAQKLQRCSRGFELDEGNYLRALEWLDRETRDDKAIVSVTEEEYERTNSQDETVR
jgi:ParB/RepB/Spo0J family partition protein